MRRARALVCVAAAAAFVTLGACGGPQGRLDAAPDTTASDELHVEANLPMQMSTTAPPKVVNVPDKAGASNCKLVVNTVGCFDNYPQLIQLVGGGIDMTRKLGG